MAYSTITDVQTACGGTERLVQLFALDRSSQNSDPAAISTAIESADRMIDSYLVKIYLVPLASPVPNEIRDCSARMAVALRRFQRAMLDPGTEKMYENDLKWLAAIRDGQCALSVAPQPQQSSMRIDSMTERALSKDVSRRKLQGFS